MPTPATAERTPNPNSPYRMVRFPNGTVETVLLMRARSLVSRRLAEYVVETPKRRGRPKGSKNKPKQNVSAEHVFANPNTPIEDVRLPGSTPTGDVADTAGDLPLRSD